MSRTRDTIIPTVRRELTMIPKRLSRSCRPIRCVITVGTSKATMMAGNSQRGPMIKSSESKVDGHTRQKPTGRKPLPEHLPRVDIEILPDDVQRQGLDAFVRIGEDVAETVERRPASLVVVRTHRPKFVPKGRDRAEETTVSQASPPELPIERGLAGPGLLADTITRRWQDHIPLNRLESIYAQIGRAHV